MISKINGTVFSKSTKTRVWWIKLGVALVLSNIFFFFLFSSPVESPAPQLEAGQVEMSLRAPLLTPFQVGKKVLLISHSHQRQIVAVLKERALEEQGFTIEVREDQAPLLLQIEDWEILPYLRTLTFAAKKKGAGHEIHY